MSTFTAATLSSALACLFSQAPVLSKGFDLCSLPRSSELGPPTIQRTKATGFAPSVSTNTRIVGNVRTIVPVPNRTPCAIYAACPSVASASTWLRRSAPKSTIRAGYCTSSGGKMSVVVKAFASGSARRPPPDRRYRCDLDRFLSVLQHSFCPEVAPRGHAKAPQGRLRLAPVSNLI